MRVLIDMNLSPRWVSFLQSNGFEANHWQDVGSPAATDSEIMLLARREGMVVLTHDLDFGAILAASGEDAPSVVQIRTDDLRPEIIGADIVAALRGLASELTAGALATVEPGRSRARLLPFAKQR